MLKILRASLYGVGLNAVTILYGFEILKRHIHGHQVLEMGPAEGVITGNKITVMEGSELFCEDLQRRFSLLKVIYRLFEEFLNEMDHYHGHRRVFTPESFEETFRKTGVAH